MISIIKIEMYKLYKSKKYIYVIMSLLFLFIFTLAIGYSSNETRYNYISYLYYLFSININLTFPLIITILFSSVIIDDFNNGAIKNLIASSYERDKIYLGKFIASTLLFFPMLILGVFLYVVILYLCFKFNNYEPFAIYSAKETIVRFTFIFMTQVIYLICYSSFISVLCWIIKKKSLAILVSLIVITTVILVPKLPHNADAYIFITNSRVYGFMFQDKFNISNIFTNLSVNICTTSAFLILGIMILKNKEFY